MSTLLGARALCALVRCTGWGLPVEQSVERLFKRTARFAFALVKNLPKVLVKRQ
jgi:hypothetical protein